MAIPNPVLIDPMKNHYRMMVSVVVEATTAEQAMQKLEPMMEAECVKSWSVAPAEYVMVGWVKED